MNATFLSPAEGDDLLKLVVSDLTSPQCRALVTAYENQDDRDPFHGCHEHSVAALVKRELAVMKDRRREFTRQGKKVARYLYENGVTSQAAEKPDRAEFIEPDLPEPVEMEL